MDYTNSVSFEGSTEKAFDLAATALTSIGFRITTRDRSSLDLAGPGMSSTRQSALLGASRIRITHGGNTLSMEAELGGVTRVKRFMTLFPIGLAFLLAIVLSLVFSWVFDHYLWLVPVVAVSGANALLWLVVGPMMARTIYARTRQGLDALLSNMAMTGNSA